MSNPALLLPCPRCQHPNAVPSPEPGHGSEAASTARFIDCERCDRSFAVGSRATPGRFHGSSPTEVGLAASGVAALVLTVVFYLVIVYPLKGSYFSALFAERGWVPYAIALMSAWAGGARFLGDGTQCGDNSCEPGVGHSPSTSTSRKRNVAPRTR